MTNSRENLGWLLGSIVTAIAMAVGWLISSGVVVNLLFLLIGFGITYFVQTRTQKRAWKREYSVKIVETVYGPFYKELKKIIEYLQRRYYTYGANLGLWKEFQQDHRYFMVDEDFRTRLDRLCKRLEMYFEAVVRLRSEIVKKIVIEETERFYKIKTNEIPTIQINYTKNYQKRSDNPDFIECVISERHPIDSVKLNEPGSSDLDLVLRIISIDNKPTNIPYSSDFDKFWQSCIKRMKEEEAYKFMVQENSSLLEEARRVQKEIVKRIEEPWKI